MTLDQAVIADLRDCFKYDPLTGKLTRRIRLGNQLAGSEVSTVWECSKSGKKYIQVMRHGKKYFAHRLILALVEGEWPSNLVDHKDGDGLNNKWCNLRKATHAQNMANMTFTRNKSGYKGVHQHKATGKWAAQIRINGRNAHIGYYDDPEEAAMAYDKEAMKAQGEFAVLNFPALNT